MQALLMNPNKYLTVISIFPMIIIKLVFIFCFFCFLFFFLGGRHPEQQASLVAQMVRSLPEMQKTQVLYPGEGNGYTLLYSCLENSINREAWWATVYEVTKSGTQLSD